MALNPNSIRGAHYFSHVFFTAAKCWTNLPGGPVCFPEGSASYSIIDMATNEDVIPFSPYTTMSCDPVSPFFTQDLNGFEPNRAYKIVIKVKHNDNQTIVYDDDFEFILRS